MFQVIVRYLAAHPQSRLSEVWKATYPEKNKTQIYKALETLVSKGFLIKQEIYYSVAKDIPIRDPYAQKERKPRLVLLHKNFVSSNNLKFMAQLMDHKNYTVESFRGLPAPDILFNAISATIAIHAQADTLDKLPWIEELTKYVNEYRNARQNSPDNTGETGTNSEFDSEESRDQQPIS